MVATIPPLKNTTELVKELENAIDVSDTVAAQKTTEKLQKIGVLILKVYFSGSFGEDNPWPIAQRLVKALSNEQIQFCDPLKQSVSKACRIFMDCVSFRCHVEGRKIYSPSKVEIVNNLQMVQSTLPETAVGTGLEVACIEAAAKALETTGTFKEFAFDALKAALNLQVVELLNPLRELWKNEWRAGGWFPITMTWRGIASRVDSIEDLNVLLEAVQSKTSQGGYYSLSASEILIDLRNRITDVTVSKKIFEELSKLASFESKGIRTHSWRTRFRTIEYLSFLVKENPTTSKETLVLLTERLLQEKDRRVLNILLDLYFSDSVRKHWQQVINESKNKSGFKPTIDLPKDRCEAYKDKLTNLRLVSDQASSVLAKKKEEIDTIENQIKDDPRQAATGNSSLTKLLTEKEKIEGDLREINEQKEEFKVEYSSWAQVQNLMESLINDIGSSS